MERVGPYELLEELGRGGSGAVYRARGPGGEEVALKVLSGGWQAPELQRRRFLREARALEGVRHPHVVRLREVGEERGAPYLVLDYHRAGSLQRVLERGGPVDVDVAEALGLQLASALEALHAQGVWHRDLKPDNVLVTDEGDALLTDFGLVKDLGRLDATAALTTTGSMLGTPGYASPEQAAGVEGDARSDVYGWGATMYAALTGRPPIEGGSLVEVLIATKEQQPVSLRRRRPEVSAAQEAVVLRCLAKEPSARWADAAALRAAWAEACATGSASSSRRAAAAAVAVALVGGVALWASREGEGGSSRARGSGAAVVGSRVEPTPTGASPPTTPTGSPAARPSPPRSEAELAAALRRVSRSGTFRDVLERSEALLAIREQPDVSYMRSVALWKTGRREEAIAEAGAAVRGRPKKAHYRLTLAEMLEASGDAAGAARQRCAVWELDRSLLTPEAREALIRGLIRVGRYRDLLYIVDGCLREEPTTWSLYTVRGIAYWELWRREEAIRDLQFVVARGPPAMAEAAKKRVARYRKLAREAARRAVLPHEVELADSIRRLAAMVGRGAYAEAQPLVEAALRRKRTPQMLRIAAQCALGLKRGAGGRRLALESLQHAGSLGDSASAAWQVVLSFLYVGDLKQSERWLNRTLDLDPKHVRALTYRGLLLFEGGCLQEAIHDFRRALTLEPGDPAGLAGRGWERYYLGRFEEALADHTQALRGLSRGEAVQAEEGRAAALVRLGRFSEARRILDRVLARAPRRYRSLLARAELRWHRGDRDGAIADQRAAVQALPSVHPERPLSERGLARLLAARERGR